MPPCMVVPTPDRALARRAQYRASPSEPAALDSRTSDGKLVDAWKRSEGGHAAGPGPTRAISLSVHPRSVRAVLSGLTCPPAPGLSVARERDAWTCDRRVVPIDVRRPYCGIFSRRACCCRHGPETAKLASVRGAILTPGPRMYEGAFCDAFRVAEPGSDVQPGKHHRPTAKPATFPSSAFRAGHRARDIPPPKRHKEDAVLRSRKGVRGRMHVGIR